MALTNACHYCIKPSKDMITFRFYTKYGSGNIIEMCFTSSSDLFPVKVGIKIKLSDVKGVISGEGLQKVDKWNF